MTLREIVGLIAAASMASGIQYDGLRVKVGWSDALADVEYFFKIPRTIGEAEAAEWIRLDPPSLLFKGVRMYCPQEREVCALYDTAGFVAGLHINLPKEEYGASPIQPDTKLMEWSAKRNERMSRKEFWFLPQYFVSQESYKAGAGPTSENGATLQDNGIWVYGPDARLMRIPLTEAELNTTVFKKQNCVPNMGTHWYYNMTPSMKCEDSQPWFVLTSEGEVVGTGFQVFGRLGKLPTTWFERLPNARRSAELSIPNGPPCLYEWASSYGVVSIHIYYVDRPWNIRCKDGDSIKPASAYERLLFNGFRYANQISDEFRRLFGG